MSAIRGRVNVDRCETFMADSLDVINNEQVPFLW